MIAQGLVLCFAVSRIYNSYCYFFTCPCACTSKAWKDVNLMKINGSFCYGLKLTQLLPLLFVGIQVGACLVSENGVILGKIR